MAAALPYEARSSPVGEVKVAFIGDQSVTAGARAVLELIAGEGADAVLHNGDFDYRDDPAAWDAQIDAILGPDFPYFASVGNHDEARFYGAGGYQELMEARMNRLGIPWQGDLGAQSVHEFQGVFFVLTAPGVFGAGDGFHDLYIRDQLAADTSVWRVSGWHENMRFMQVGGKGDSTGWGVYEASRRGGAVITTGHSHTYSRSHLLSSMELQEIADADSDFVIDDDDPATAEDEGRTFTVVSGIAGRGIRNQERDDAWWASIYTSTQNAEFGALFGVFNEGGVPNRARFYFMNVAGEVIDEFFVTSAVNADLEPTLLVEDVSVSEGDAGSLEAEVHVVLLSPGQDSVSVDYATADDSATAGLDYEATSGQLVFPAGVTEQTVRVPVHGDTLDESDEAFSIEFSNPVNAALPYASSVVTILDDDEPDPAPEPVLLSVDWTGFGNVLLDPSGGSYEPGTPVTLTAVAAAGYGFDRWSGDIAGSTNPVTIVMDADRTATAHFLPSIPVEPTLQETQSGGSSLSGLVSTDRPVGAAPDALYLAAVASKPDVEVTGVSGLGLQWTPVLQQCGARQQTGVVVWQARGTPTADDVVTADFGSTPANAVIAVSRYAAARGVNVTNAASANSLGVSGACAGGTDSDTYAFDLATRGTGSTVVVAVAMRLKAHEPGPGFVELAELYQGADPGGRAGLALGEAAAQQASSVEVSGSFNGTVDWAAVALELDTPRFYDLDILEFSGGSVATEPEGTSHVEDSEVTLTATPDPGHLFLGWIGAISGGQGNPATVVMDADKVVGAFFVPAYTVTLAPSSGGSTALSPPPDANGVYARGSAIAVTATPDPGHVFLGWSGDLAGTDNPGSLLMSSDKQIGASFAPAYSMNVTPSTGGSVALSPANGPYPLGTVVTLTATPDPGFFFGGWSGDVPAGAGNPATLVMDADKQVGASFASGFAVTLQPTAGGSVDLSPPATGPYPIGATVTATASPDPDHVFVGWSGDLAGSPNPASITSETHVVAEFLPLEPQLEQIVSGGSSESTIVATAAPIAAAAGDLYLATISTKRHEPVLEVTGLGLVWTPLHSQCAARGQTGLSVWTAQGQPAADGVVTATLGATVRNAVIAVSRYSGAPSVGSVLSGNTLGVSGSCSGGSDNPAYSFDFDTTAAKSILQVAVAARMKDNVPGAGLVETLQIYQGLLDGDRVGLSLAERVVESPSRVNVSGTLASAVDWALVSIEIRGPLVE